MPFGDFFLECTSRPRREGQPGRSALQSPVSRPRRSPGKPSPKAASAVLPGNTFYSQVAGASSQFAGGSGGGAAPSPGYRAGMAMVLDTGYLSPPVTTTSVRVKQAAPVGTFRLDS
jgi:hypothetical protein